MFPRRGSSYGPPAVPVSGGAAVTPILPPRPLSLASEPKKQIVQLMRRKALETLIAEIEHSYNRDARLKALLAEVRTSRSLTGLPGCGREGMAWPHVSHLAGTSLCGRSLSFWKGPRCEIYGREFLDKSRPRDTQSL